MSPLKQSNNIAARMGRWSASHWKTAVFGWLAFVVAALAIGGVVGTKNIDVQNANVGETHRADTILKDYGFGQSDPQTEIVVVQSKTLKVDSPAFRSAVNGVVHAVAPFRTSKGRTIDNLRSPLDPAHSDQISADGHTALVEWDMKGTNKVATDNIDPLTAATAAVAKQHPGIYIGEAGSISSGKAINKLFSDQLKLVRRAVHSADADHPRARVRRDRRGGRAAAPRALGRARDARAARTPEPPHPDGPERQCSRAADRARSRSRLRALLSPARA